MGVFYLEIYDKYLAFVGLGRECGENKKDLNCEEIYFFFRRETSTLPLNLVRDELERAGLIGSQKGPVMKKKR